MSARDPEELVRAVIAAGVRDPAVLDAFRAVPRSRFVPPGERSRAYADVPIPIGHDQVTTQPSLSAQMVAALSLAADDAVLEVGTGLGFQTAVLARLGRHVWSVERWEELARAARANLRAHGVPNVEVVVGDGSAGLERHAPYDAVIVSAAFTEVPPPLVEQLAPGGRLVQPIGPGGAEEVLLFEKRAGRLRCARRLTGAHFVPLVGRHGFDERKPAGGRG